MDRKTAYKLAALVFMSAILLLTVTSNAQVVAGETGTSVEGVISHDTTWTSDGSPYYFIDDVIVANSVTLTIAPDTIVNIQDHRLLVEGTLCAKGTETNQILFEGEKPTAGSWPPRIYFNESSTPWDETTGTGCIIDHAQINVPNYQYETILGEQPKISNNLFYNYGNDAAAIRTNGLIVNNTILGGYRGIVVAYSTPKILYNTVKDADVGICCGYMSFDPVYHPTVIGNLLTNNSRGIEIYECAPYIANNTIVNNTQGVFFYDYAFGRDAGPEAIIYNNIYDNSYNVYVESLYPQTTINMSNNWWGTTDSSKIANSIRDNKNDTAVSKVDYIPFLNEPNPQASPNTPPTTPTPSPSTAPSPTPNSFSIESNSTVSALSFNGTSSEISFTVNGTTGTTGYVKATISKDFMPNGDNIKVYLDGNPINYTMISEDASWIITFTYNHSEHQVKINDEKQTIAKDFSDELIIVTAAIIGVALLSVLGLLFWLTKQKLKGQQQT